MILPDRVLGSSGTTRIDFGLAIGPISLDTWLRSSWINASSAFWPSSSADSRRITKALTAWPVSGSLAPTTAASATFGCETSADSISVVDSRWPDTFITSSTRPSSQMSPSSSSFAPSPAKYMPLNRDQYVSLYRWSSPQIVRSIAGQGLVSTRYPPDPGCTAFPSSSTTSAETPGSAFIAEPGLPRVTPGSGLIMCMPVSVFHQVSTTGVRPPPMVSRYQM